MPINRIRFLKNILALANLTQRAIAQELGLSQSMIEFLLSGSKEFSDEYFSRILKYAIKNKFYNKETDQFIILDKEVGLIIKKIRLASGYSRKEYAKLLKIKYNQLLYWETTSKGVLLKEYQFILKHAQELNILTPNAEKNHLYKLI